MISIFLPTYNCSSAVSETIDSILSQSYTDFELLCVDDGSTDNTVDILNGYSAKDNRVKVFTKQNQGIVPYSWNYIFPHLSGEFTLYMSHDDLLEPSFLEKMTEAQSKANADVVISSVVFFENDFNNPESIYGETNKKNDMANHSVVSGKDAFIEMLNYDIPGFGLWRTTLIKSIGMPTESFNSDEAMQRIWVKHCEVVAFSDAKFGYRQSSSSIVKGLKPYHYASLLSQRRLLAETTIGDFVKYKEVRKFIVHFIKSLVYLTRQYFSNKSKFTEVEDENIRDVFFKTLNFKSTSPSSENKFTWTFFCIYTILLFIPDVLKLEAPGIVGYIASYGFNFMFGITLSVVSCVVGDILRWVNKSLYWMWHVMIHLIVISYVSSELFLILTFNLQWNAFTFQLVNETTVNETLGFFNSYLSFHSISLLAVSLSAIGVVEMSLCSLLKKVIDRYNQTMRCLRWLIGGIAIAFVSVEAKCFTLSADRNYANSDKLIRRDGLWNLYQSCLQYNDQKGDIHLCIEAQHDLKIDGCDYLSSNIVVIIGETFNRHHSNLYGYGLETNPKIEKMQCYIFDDVVSPANATTTAFKYFLSFANTNNAIRWCDTPLFPSLFRKCGYNVVLYSNQYVVEGGLEHFNASAGFFNHPSIYRQLFNARNHELCSFDGDMISEYEKHRGKLERDSLNLIIFHLHGQHSPAVERYPSEYSRFGSKDILREDLSMSQKEEVAQYDNATLYNDDVVAHIMNMYEEEDAIVIYFADHAEEIYDFRDKAGRFYDIENVGFQVARNQLDIPFIVFASEKYKCSHPDIIREIENSLHKPFMTDDLPHVLLGLAGINTSWYIPERDLFNPQFDVYRKRIISGTELDYNEMKSKSNY